MGVGLAQGAYDLAYAYALERQQFGKPIASFQAVQFQLADLATEIEAGRALVYRAAWLKDEGRPFALAAAQAKLYTGLLSNRAANVALQIHGGYGFMDEFADLAALPRPEDPRDRRGHERGAAHGDRPAPRPAGELATHRVEATGTEVPAPAPAWDAAPLGGRRPPQPLPPSETPSGAPALSPTLILAVRLGPDMGRTAHLRGPAGHYRKDSESPLLASARDAVPAVRRRGPRAAPPTSSATPTRARRCWSTPPTRSSRTSPRPSRHGRAHRARARDAHARRPRLGPRPARARARHPGLDPRRRGRRVSARRARGRRRDRGRLGRASRASTRPATGPSTAASSSTGTLFTGDSLFVGAVARPDLAVEAREGAEGMFHSLHRLLELADDVQVFPGHVAGSLCGTGMSPDAVHDDRGRAPRETRCWRSRR